MLLMLSVLNSSWCGTYVTIHKYSPGRPRMHKDLSTLSLAGATLSRQKVLHATEPNVLIY
jgi:hypothetical protein